MSNFKLDNLQLPAGRLVMGSLTERQDKDFDNNPIPVDKQRLFFGVAVPKTDPGIEPLWGQIYNMAASHYAPAPAVMAQIQQGFAAKDFSWKIQDGDVPTIDSSTGQYREIRDYMKGCLIFKFSTMFDVDCIAVDQGGQHVQITPGDIKRGDYVDLIFNTSPNDKMGDQADIYLNPVAVRRVGFGDAIASGVSAMNAFANAAPAALPPGASQMPTAAPMAAPMPTAAPMPNTPVAQPEPAMVGNVAPMPTATSPTVAPAPVQTAPAPTQTVSTASPSNVPPHPDIMTPPQQG